MKYCPVIRGGGISIWIDYEEYDYVINTYIFYRGVAVDLKGSACNFQHPYLKNRKKYVDYILESEILTEIIFKGSI